MLTRLIKILFAASSLAYTVYLFSVAMSSDNAEPLFDKIVANDGIHSEYATC